MEKNTITSESCRNVLLKELKADIQTIGLILPLILVAFVPIIWGCISFVLSDDATTFGRVFTAVVFVPILSAVPLYFIYKLLSSLTEMSMINNFRFSIIKDTVTKTEIETIRRHEEPMAHFKNFGKFPISRVQYNLTSVNDEYYLVILNCNKKILNAYYTGTTFCPEAD